MSIKSVESGTCAVSWSYKAIVCFLCVFLGVRVFNVESQSLEGNRL